MTWPRPLTKAQKKRANRRLYLKFKSTPEGREYLRARQRFKKRKRIKTEKGRNISNAQIKHYAMRKPIMAAMDQLYQEGRIPRFNRSQVLIRHPDPETTTIWIVLR